MKKSIFTPAQIIIATALFTLFITMCVLFPTELIN
jgi:hypothetical protein